MSPRRRKLAKFLIRVFVTVALLIWIFTRIDFEQFRTAAETAHWPFVIAVWFMTAVVFAIGSMKLKFILRKQNCDLRAGTIFGASAVALLYSMVMPDIVSTAVKWYVLKKNTGKGSNVLSGMLYNQLSTGVLMTVFGLIALIVANPSVLVGQNSWNPWLLPMLSAAAAAGLTVISALLLNSRSGRKLVRASKVLLMPFPAKVRKKGEDLLDQITIFQTAGLRFHLICALFTVAGMLGGGVLIYFFAAKAANITVPLATLVWLWAIVYVLGKLPISIANLGVREVTLVGCLSIYGIQTASSLLMSMILFSAVLFMAAIGTVFQVVWAAKSDQT